MDGVRAMSESISPGFSLPVLVQVRDLLSGTQKVSDPGRRMEGLGKDKGRPKDRARAPTVAVTGSGGGRRRSASVAASGGGAIAVYSSANRVIVRCDNQREIGKDEAREIFTVNVELNQNVTQQSSDLSSPSAVERFAEKKYERRGEERAQTASQKRPDRRPSSRVEFVQGTIGLPRGMDLALLKNNT
ncbi:uncharacterized protein FOBCDRAFT_198637 [Fusarium oxysporum Fo47]|uniref:uncharacterized protein n=1 Tax=Fusarium oxysporum Fo47 TaxID=660027 RepID=UPI00286998F2|nr:uncharacterized protein FOBCDRAFT_198637 [Fusarium oxysporum Fo47]WJG34971.1 hypothetical protein FOBCDRAFT_198637 [Fusarium oxysporum Fo47]